MRRSYRGDSVAGRALVVVIAIMTFLACLTAGAALLVADASQAWRSDVLREATIQVKPRAGDDVESLVAKAVAIATQTPDVESAHALSQAELEKLLEPWLGTGLDLSQLPVPRLIAVQTSRPALRRPRDIAFRRSPQPFRRPILTTIGCGPRASAPWPMLSSFSPPLFSC